MMAGMDHDTQLGRYAVLALHVGVGPRPGQRLLLRGPVAAAPLARRIADAACRAGSPFVHVDWSDEEITKTRFPLAPDGSFEEVPLGRAEKGQDVLDRLLASDDGARRLGEVALVSVDSPIHRSGLRSTTPCSTRTPQVTSRSARPTASASRAARG